MNYGTKFLILSIFPDGNNITFENETNPDSSFYFENMHFWNQKITLSGTVKSNIDVDGLQYAFMQEMNYYWAGLD